MPWHIGTSSECPASKPYAVIKDSDGSVSGCHATKKAAADQLAALYASEGDRAMDERAQLAAKRINDLPDSAFAYIEPGGKKDEQGKTVPRSKRHFPIHDAAHVRNALARAPQSPFGKKAMPKILAAAKKFGIHVASETKGSEVSVSDIERRYTLVPVELRAHENRRSIGGYAAVFNRASQNLGGFIEIVTPSAFNNNRARGWPDVLARYNHDNNMLLGTIGGGTLRLNIDDTGLFYEVDPPVARADVTELVERGDVRKSSFAFRMVENGDDWTMSDQGYPQRNLLEVQLVDVAPVNLPAYMDTNVGMRGVEVALRSLAAKVEATIEEVQELAHENELRKLLVRTDGPAAKPKPTTFGRAAVLELQRKPDPAV